MKKIFTLVLVGLVMTLLACDPLASTSASSTNDTTPTIFTTSTTNQSTDTTTTNLTNDTTTTTVTNSTSTDTTSTTTTTNLVTLRVYTLTELATFNGDNGTLAYMAVNGVIYDVTHADEFSNGWHKGYHLAGTDATALFAESPHSTSILATLPIVGTLG